MTMTVGNKGAGRFVFSLLLLFVSALKSTSDAFVPSVISGRTLHNTMLRLSWWETDDEEQRKAMENNIARTDVQTFLTQRSIQSFINLLVSCRDPHTVKWLEEFGGWQNMESYHGLGALNNTRFPSWDSPFLEMMKQPEDVVVVSARRRGRGHGGWSKDNPYLEDRFVEFRIDIDPISLVSRILAVREQLAGEWVEDLDTLIAANDMVLTSYEEKMLENRETPSDDDAPDGVPQASAFDRNGMFFLRNSYAFNDLRSSPLRSGTYDLLLLMATQESIHRVLRQYMEAGDKRRTSFTWFREYYTQRAAKTFDGNQEHGSADDFLEELLLSPPAVRTEGNTMQLIDPLRVAEDILQTRGQVAKEWKDTISMVSQDHTKIRDEVSARQMVKWTQKKSQIEGATESPTSFQ